MSVRPVYFVELFCHHYSICFVNTVQSKLDLGRSKKNICFFYFAIHFSFFIFYAAPRWRGGVVTILDQYGGACHVHPDAVPVRCRVAASYADKNPNRPSALGMGAREVRFGRLSLEQGRRA